MRLSKLIYKSKQNKKEHLKRVRTKNFYGTGIRTEAE